ncbi:hypothetical protein ACH47X_23700 [Promicromonospora kroppenstedtii]|uniref:Uncharacterized protein n=1 Tax=Promicromonospora kroppenstedtii TaxID=440482 RepID=A0ABW7XQV8_9MICO
MSESELHVVPDEMKAGARHLRDLAGLLVEPFVTGAVLACEGSPAEADLADRGYDGSWGRPTFQVVHQAANHVNVVSDHLHAMSAVILARETVLAVSTLSRTVLESLSVLNWLYEPEIDIQERIRRRYNIRLLTLREQRNLVRGFVSAGDPRSGVATGSLEKIGQEVLTIKSNAKRFGLDYKAARTRVAGLDPMRYLGQRVPSDQKLIDALLATSASSGNRIGLAMHRITSATAHGQSHGSQFFMLEAVDSSEPGLGSVQFGLDLSHFSTLLGSVFLGLQNARKRLRDYYGWPDEPWQAGLRSAMATYNGWLDIERRASEGER